MLQVNRIYKNTDGNELRTDIISLNRKRDNIVVAANKTNNSGYVYNRHVKTTYIHDNLVTDRDVASIQITGDYDEIDTNEDRAWVSWNLPTGEDNANDKKTRLNMSDLPGIGDTV